MKEEKFTIWVWRHWSISCMLCYFFPLWRTNSNLDLVTQNKSLANFSYVFLGLCMSNLKYLSLKKKKAQIFIYNANCINKPLDLEPLAQLITIILSSAQCLAKYTLVIWESWINPPHLKKILIYSMSSLNEMKKGLKESQRIWIISYLKDRDWGHMLGGIKENEIPFYVSNQNT